MSSCSAKISGVYRINLSSGHFYVGRSSDVRRRVRVHLRRLGRGIHENPYMQRVYDQHPHFEWEVLRVCTTDEALRLEQGLLDTLVGTEGCVNLNRSASVGPGMTGRRHSEATKARIREKRARQTFSEETRQKLSKASRGNKRQKGHPHSMETRLRISEVRKGKPFSESHRAAVARANVKYKSGKPLSEEHRAALSRAQKERWAKSRSAEKSDTFTGTIGYDVFV